MRQLYRLFTMIMVFVTMIAGPMGSAQAPMLFSAMFLSSSSTAEAADCPWLTFTAQGNAEITLSYDPDHSSYMTIRDGDNDWKAIPYTDPPGNVSWIDEFYAVGTNSNSSEWAMGIDTLGNLHTFGSNGVTVNVPSGNGPYALPRGGSNGRFSVLAAYGLPVNWGNSSNGWLTSEPTTTGWTALDVGRDVACAVSWHNNGGVECWGYDIEGMIASPSRPRTGNFQSVTVGRYVAIAVDNFGNMIGWRTTRAASGMISTADAFLANMPTSGVENVDVSETGELIGVAWMADGSIVIWQDPNKPLQPALRSAPGFTAYGSGSLRSYTPRGPDGNITFRTQPFVTPYGYLTASAVAGVIDDPQGLVDDRVGVYDFGDAVYWNGTYIMVGGVPKFEPILADACN